MEICGIVFQTSCCLSFSLSLLPFFLPGPFCECLAYEIRRMLHDFFQKTFTILKGGCQVDTLTKSIKSGPCGPLPKRAAHISSSLCASKLASSTPLICVFSEDENSCVKHQRMSEKFLECMPESGGCSLYEVCLASWTYLAIGNHFQRLWPYLLSFREGACLAVTMPSSAFERIDRFSRNVVSP